jgi:hypothetical protein
MGMVVVAQCCVESRSFHCILGNPQAFPLLFPQLKDSDYNAGS